MTATYDLHHGDSLEVLASLPDDSVDLVLTDPPYFRVKNLPWDRAWKSDAGFLGWLGDVTTELARVLRPNGSLYLFASPRMAARVEMMVGERMKVLAGIVWEKRDTCMMRNSREALRSYLPASERIIFAEQFGQDVGAMNASGYVSACERLRADVFSPIRDWLNEKREAAGLTIVQVDGAWQRERSSKGHMASHWFGPSQWLFPTPAHWAFLERCGIMFADGPEASREQYEELREQYEELRRPFFLTPDVPCTDVWRFPTAARVPGRHPCEKPVEMLQHIVRTSSRPGAVVLDAFAGSGSTGEAALSLGRSFIGIEKDAEWIKKAGQRLSSVAHAQDIHHAMPEPDQGELFKHALPAQLDLFGEPSK